MNLNDMYDLYIPEKTNCYVVKCSVKIYIDHS